MKRALAAKNPNENNPLKTTLSLFKQHDEKWYTDRLVESRTTVRQQREAIQKHEANITQLKATIKELEKDKDSLARSNEELLDKLKNEQKTNNELQQKINEQSREIKDLEEANEDEKKRVEDYEEILDELDNEKKKLEAENAQLKSQLESSNHSEQMESLFDELEDKDKTIDELKQAIVDLQDENSSATDSIAQLQRTIDLHAKEIESKTMQVEEYKERYTQYMQEDDQDSSQASHENKVIQVLKANIQKKEATIQSMYERIDAFSETVKGHESQIQNQTTRIQRLESELVDKDTALVLKGLDIDKLTTANKKLRVDIKQLQEQLRQSDNIAMGTRKPVYIKTGPHQRKPDLKQQSINTMLNRQKISAINNATSSQGPLEENKENRPAFNINPFASSQNARSRVPNEENKENRPAPNINPFQNRNGPIPKIAKKRKTSDIDGQNSKKVMVDKENIAVKQEPVEINPLSKGKEKQAQPLASTSVSKGKEKQAQPLASISNTGVSKGKEQPLGNISNTEKQQPHPSTTHKHQGETCVSCANFYGTETLTTINQHGETTVVTGQERMQMNTRHRHPRAKTPPGFWNVEFNSPEKPMKP